MGKRLVEFAELFFDGCVTECYDIGLEMFSFFGAQIDAGNQIEDLDLLIIEFLSGIVEYENLNKFEEYPLLSFFETKDKSSSIKESIEYLLETKQVNWVLNKNNKLNALDYLKQIANDLISVNLKVIYFKMTKETYVFGLVKSDNAQRLIDIYNDIADEDSNIEAGVL